MLNLLKKLYFLPFFLVVFVSMAAAAVEEYPLFNTLEGFTYHPKMSKSRQFDTYTFKTGKTPNDKVTVEGKFFDLHYKLNKGVETPGGLLVIRNFTNAVRQTGGEVLYESRDSAVMRIIQGDKEIWVRVNCAANGGWYALNIIEKSSMKQELVVNPILDAIDGTGKATVYISFDTASSQMKPDADSVIKDIFSMLSQRSNLKLSIEGHTDGDGTMEGNQKLSIERAQAVKNALIAQGIDHSRLVAKGYGMSMPIADNTTESGKAKNRRVELVKIN